MAAEEDQVNRLRVGYGRVHVVCAGGQAEEDEEEISARHCRVECYELRSRAVMHGEGECYALEIECYTLGKRVLYIVNGGAPESVEAGVVSGK